MFRLTRIAAALLLLATVRTAEAGPILNGHEYDLVFLPVVDWNTARGAALGLGDGWDLAAITSAPEHDFVAALLGTAYHERAHFWVGGTDLGTEGQWRWVTGEAFSYESWWPGEPNNAGAEHYLAYDLRPIVNNLGGIEMSWAWNDAPDEVAHWIHGFVAERVAPGNRDDIGQDLPEPAGFLLAGAAVLASAAWRRARPRG